MLKEEIVEKISKYFKLTSFEAEKIYNDIFSIIISGVKQDNIVDVANFGEFIIKFNKNNGDSDVNGYKKTVEFLATSRLEDEINQNAGENIYFTPSISEHVTVNQTTGAPIKDEIVTEKTEEIQKTTFIPMETNSNKEETVSKPVEKKYDTLAETNSSKEDTNSNPVEEELKRKREEILYRLNKPDVENLNTGNTLTTKPLWKIPESEREKMHVENAKEKVQEKIHEINDKLEAPVEKTVIPPVEEIKAEKKTETEIKEKEPAAEKKEEKKTEEIDDLSQKTFSDFFTEAKEEKVSETANIEDKTQQPVLQNVIPPSVVDLHNEITGSGKHETMTFPTVEAVKTPVITNGNGNGNGSGTGEYRASDNSYYIWYKDVEANATDTQNLSYEYELLYQATKEAEYKSKLKIYVTTFIIFFSVVLVLLIFSPVIYKIFFKPVEQQKNESVNEDKPATESTDPNNKAEQNTLTDANTQNNQQNNQNNPPPVTNNETQNNTQQSTTQQNTTQQTNTQQSTDKPVTETKKDEPVQQQTQPKTQTAPPTQTQPQQDQTKLDGVTQNSMGWMDDKLKVIYVKLDNGKFTIQESAWDSNEKANKRLGIVQSYKIDGLSGSVVKADISGKGTWFRARFGEFSTLEQARKKAEELRRKEGMKLQASLLLFLLYA